MKQGSKDMESILSKALHDPRSLTQELAVKTGAIGTQRRGLTTRSQNGDKQSQQGCWMSSTLHMLLLHEQLHLDEEAEVDNVVWYIWASKVTFYTKD